MGPLEPAPQPIPEADVKPAPSVPLTPTPTEQRPTQDEIMGYHDEDDDFAPDDDEPYF